MEGTLLDPGGQHSGHRHRTNTSAREATFSKPSLCPRGQHGWPWFRRKDVSCLHLQVLRVHWWLYGQETQSQEKFQPEGPQNLRLEEGPGMGASSVSFMTEGTWE